LKVEHKDYSVENETSEFQKKHWLPPSLPRPHCGGLPNLNAMFNSYFSHINEIFSNARRKILKFPQ